MSRDRTHDTAPQGGIPLPNLTEQLFGPDIGQAWVAESGRWDGCFYSKATVAAFSPDTRHHVSCSLMKPGAKSRNLANFDGAILFVLDDVGTAAPDGSVSITQSKVDRDAVNMFAPSGFYAVETSKGNFQIGWRIEREPDLAKWERFLHGMEKHPIYGKGVHDAVHYFRMETGSGKPEKGAFKTKLVKPWDGTIWKLDDLAEAFGIDLSEPIAQSPAAPTPTGETLSPDAVSKLLEMIPAAHADEHDTWIRVGHAVYGATSGSEEGRDLFVEWSRQSGKFDVKKSTSDTWDSFFAARASASTLRVIIEELHGPDSPERQKASQIFAAGGAFDVVEEEAIPMPERKETGSDEKKFRELLAEIAKTQKVPAHHKGGNGKAYDAHWLPVGGGLLDMGSLSASLPVAPPVIFEPFVRGGLSVIGGAPSIGKSNLSLNQALAMAAGRADLLRRGVRLQFPGDVVYVSNEDDLSVLQRRAAAWASHHKVDLAAMPHKLLLVRTGLFKRDGDNWRASCLEVLERLLEHGKAGADIAMIFVDTLGTSVTGIDEHQIKDITPVMGFLRDIASSLWCAVGFLHHTTKEAWARGSADTTLRSIATIRGSGGITGTFTRGATLVCAPDKLELDAHPDWAGRDIVVEFMAKANDGPEGFVACYYERVLVPVEQISAEDALVREFRDEPVLVAFQPTVFGADVSQLDGYLDDISAWPEPVQIVDKLASNGSPNSVQKVLGVNNQAAKTIVDALVAAKKVTIEETPLPKSRVLRTLKITPVSSITSITSNTTWE